MRYFVKVFVFLNLTVLTLSTTINAQLVNPDSLTISGIVLDSDSLSSLPNVHITTHKNTGTVSDVLGQFAFKANVNDTLTFSFIGYKDYVFTIPDTLKYKNYMMGVILNRDTILLSEIIILPWLNKNQFKEAFINNQPDIQTVNATRNLNMMKYTSHAYAPTWGASDMVEYQLKQYAQSVEYKGMVSPSQSFNIVGFASYLIYISQQQLTKEEKEYRLRKELRQYIQQKHPE